MPITQYTYLYQIFQHYNKELFAGELPEPLFTIAKLPNVASGVFTQKKWIDKLHREVHQITIVPIVFRQHTVMDLHQLIVHEMTHIWQHEYGKPSRNGYHNKEWANKMLEIGLIPSDTGATGGKMTGQKVGDYPQSGGKFMQAFQKVGNIEIPLVYKD